ncbi:hypothetical protein CK203_059003 [Vitis vinifera]|uniref:NB-ARC domain-containing protein n=1 Tax=Vitis vinifera TaxID=29760 RepID=A0A438GEN1_VITVI|nr:hypothetical protein CK203_059003 [Vitis vinifera]
MTNGTGRSGLVFKPLVFRTVPKSKLGLLRVTMRATKKKAREVVEIQGARKFKRLLYHAPLPGIGSATLKGYKALESRMSTLNQIMEALRDGDVNMIWVWGMGGVGKTILMKQVAQYAKE